MRIVVAALLIAALGCSKSKPATTPPPANEPAPIVEAPPEPAPEPTPPPPMSDAEFTAFMEQAVAMFDAMGRAAEAAGDDCAKVSAGLEKVMDDHAAFVATAKRYKGDKDLETRGEAWMKDNMQRVMEPMMKVATAGQKCASDPAFQAFQQRFEATL